MIPFLLAAEFQTKWPRKPQQWSTKKRREAFSCSCSVTETRIGKLKEAIAVALIVGIKTTSKKEQKIKKSRILQEA